MSPLKNIIYSNILSLEIVGAGKETLKQRVTLYQGSSNRYNLEMQKIPNAVRSVDKG
jgi:hypothetical protein